jgi:hypothetical protein
MFGWFKKSFASSNTPRRVGVDPAAFVLPLGVIPLRDGQVFQRQLVNGFVKGDGRGRFTTEYNISLSVDRIEALVNAFAAQVLPPNRSYGILEWDEIGDGTEKKHVYVTPVQALDPILAGLKPYLFRIVHDGMVGFGLAGGDSTAHEEVFVTAKKIVRIMTSQVVTVEGLLAEMGIERFRRPQFISDYPTANGDLMSLSHVFPKTHGQFNSKEFLSGVYVPELVDRLGFREDLVSRG